MTALMLAVVGATLLFALLVLVSIHRVLFGPRVLLHGGAR